MAAGLLGILERPDGRLMDFSEALKTLKRGGRVARAGWNGEGIYIQMWDNQYHLDMRPSHMDLPFIFIDTSGLMNSNPKAIKGRVPWLASQTDLLADDWFIVN